MSRRDVLFRVHPPLDPYCEGQHPPLALSLLVSLPWIAYVQLGVLSVWRRGIIVCSRRVAISARANIGGCGRCQEQRRFLQCAVPDISRLRERMEDAGQEELSLVDVPGIPHPTWDNDKLTTQ